MRKLAAEPNSWKFVLRADIGNVECAMLADPAKCWLINTDFRRGARHRYWTKMSPHNHHVLLAESQHHVINPTNPRRALDDGVEDRLHVRRRAADDPEHLGGCRLMLQGLAQFGVALLEFLEQTDVLDGDHGLVGEGFKQLDLLVSKRTNFHAANQNRSNRNAFTQQGVLISTVRNQLFEAADFRKFTVSTSAARSCT